MDQIDREFLGMISMLVGSLLGFVGVISAVGTAFGTVAGSITAAVMGIGLWCVGYRWLSG